MFDTRLLVTSTRENNHRFFRADFTPHCQSERMAQIHEIIQFYLEN